MLAELSEASAIVAADRQTYAQNVVLACCFEVSLAAVKYAPVHDTRSGDQQTLTRIHMHTPAYRASLRFVPESTCSRAYNETDRVYATNE